LKGAAALVAKPAFAAPQQVRAAEPADRPGADFMIDVFKSLAFEYCFAMPGSSFAGIHESMINYGGNKDPEYITCCHEESSVAMANGYGKIEGKPVMVCAQGLKSCSAENPISLIRSRSRARRGAKQKGNK
jgi:hypothetical protein